ncbi:MAG: methionine--tRNA ligase, partial [Actinomycetota bacterium]|nr:methionine--tRNA ligase [Actinomycetota bacterium]
SGDADFREELLAARGNELADDLGNLINRTATLVRRFRPEGVGSSPSPPKEASALVAAVAASGDAIDDALDRFDFRSAADALCDVVAEANRFVSTTRPWELGRSDRRGDAAVQARLDAVLAVLLDACRCIAHEIQPFLPSAAGRIEGVLAESDAELGRALFRKVEFRPA